MDQKSGKTGRKISVPSPVKNSDKLNNAQSRTTNSNLLHSPGKSPFGLLDDDDEEYIPSAMLSYTETKNLVVFFTDRAHLRCSFSFEDMMILITL
jgi:hypothetical protein